MLINVAKNILTIFLPASPNTNIKRIPSTKLSPNAKPTPVKPNTTDL